MPNSYNRRIRLVSLSALMFGILLLFAVSIVSYRYIKRLSENNNILYLDYSFYKSYEAINTNIFYLQSHEWAYLLSGNESHLTDNQQYKKVIREKIKTIEPFFNTSPGIQQFNAYKDAIDAKLKNIDLVIDYRKTRGKAASDSIINIGNGPLLTQKILNEGEKIKRLLQADMDLDKKNSDKLVREYNKWDMSNFLLTFLIAVTVSVFLFRNLSKQHLLTLQLKQEKKKAEDAVIIKEQFLANMSHEIRTPMNAIIGFTNLLNKTHLNEKQETYVKAIKSSSANLLTITNDILDYSKLESGMFRIEKIDFDIRSLIHSAFTLFSERAATNKIQYICNIDDDIPSFVLGDPTRLTQIIVNLLSNAFKFTTQGMIKLDVKMSNKDERKVCLKFNVTDTGIGIKRENIGKIFERFSQAESSITRQYGGTGLGLSIVKRLIEIQEGFIAIESVYGEGTQFVFEIPYGISKNDTETTPIKQKETIELNVGAKKILLVEDNTLNQLLARELLESYGLEVTSTINGETAIELLKEHSFDLILMDLQMPVMDGYTATGIIRNKLRINTPVIAMSAHVLAAEREKCLKSGMNDFVFKPFNEEEFKTVLKKYLALENKPPAGMDTFNNRSVVDLSSVTQMSKGNDVFVKKMIGLFLTDTPHDLSKLIQAFANKDLKQVKALAHKLKTSAGIIGMRKEAYNSLQEIEDKALEGEIVVLDTNIKQFEHYYSEAEIFLKSLG